MLEQLANFGVAAVGVEVAALAEKVVLPVIFDFLPVYNHEHVPTRRRSFAVLAIMCPPKAKLAIGMTIEICVIVRLRFLRFLDSIDRFNIRHWVLLHFGGDTLPQRGSRMSRTVDSHANGGQRSALREMIFRRQLRASASAYIRPAAFTNFKAYRASPIRVASGQGVPQPLACDATAPGAPEVAAS